MYDIFTEMSDTEEVNHGTSHLFTDFQLNLFRNEAADDPIVFKTVL